MKKNDKIIWNLVVDEIFKAIDEVKKIPNNNKMSRGERYRLLVDLASKELNIPKDELIAYLLGTTLKSFEEMKNHEDLQKLIKKN